MNFTLSCSSKGTISGVFSETADSPPSVNPGLPPSHLQPHSHLCIPDPYLDPGEGKRLVKSQTGPGHPYPGQIAMGAGGTSCKACLGHCLPTWPEGGAEALAALVGWGPGPSAISHPCQSSLPCKLSDTHLSGSSNPSGEPQRCPQWPAPQATLL